MAGSSLAVKITADTVALRAQLAVAQAEVRNFSAEVKNIADIQLTDVISGTLTNNPSMRGAY